MSIYGNLDKIILDEIESGVYYYEIIKPQQQPEVNDRFQTLKKPEQASSVENPEKIWQTLAPKLRNSISQAILKFVNVLDLAKKKKSTSWSNLMQMLKKSINNSTSEKNLISNSFWTRVIDKFQPYTLTKEQKLNFIKLMKKYFNCNSEKEKKDPQKLFRILGSRFLQLELDLYFRHKSYITYAQFISTQGNSLVSELENMPNRVPLNFNDLSFDMSLKESTNIAQVVKTLCKDNLDAFSFLSLYFLKSIQERLKTQQYSEVQKQFNSIVKHLKLAHEPKPVEKSPQMSLSFIIMQAAPSIKEDKTKRQKKQLGPKGGAEQLISWIHDKIHHAQLDFNEFQKLSANCVNGFNFKSCLKINDKNQRFSIMRIIEKLLQDYIGKNGKYKSLLDDFKKETKKFYSNIKKSSPNFLQDLADAQIEQISKFMNKILQTQTTIEWNIKDLLRGKCTFNSVEDIEKTLRNLQGKTTKKNKNKHKEVIQQKEVEINQKNDLFDFTMRIQSKKLQKTFQIIEQSEWTLSYINDSPSKIVTGTSSMKSVPVKFKNTSSIFPLLEEENQVYYKANQPNEGYYQPFKQLQDSNAKKQALMGKRPQKIQYFDSFMQKPKKNEQIQQKSEKQKNLKYKIIQTKNRLAQPKTHDFVVILHMENGTIAELQLALNQDSFAYEFDHKFYELERHSLFTPITNLYLNHNKWSEQFFDDFIENFNNMAKGKSKIDQNINLEKYKKSMNQFEKQIKKYKQYPKDGFDLYLMQKQAEFSHIKQRFDQLFQKKRFLTQEKLRIPRNKEQQRKYEINFLLGLRDYRRARQKLEFGIEKSTVLGNPGLRELYAQILMENVLYCKMGELEKEVWSEACVEQFMELQKLYSREKKMREMENVYRKLGKLYLNTNDYKNSQKYLTLALNLRKQIDQQESLIRNSLNEQKIPSIQQAQILLRLGQALYNQGTQNEGTYKRSLNTLQQSQQIFKQHRQADSLGMAQVFLWQGKVISSSQGNLGDASDKFSNSIQIVTKKKGYNSIELADVLESVAWHQIDDWNFEEAYKIGNRAYQIYFHVFGNGDRRTEKMLKLMERANRKTGFV